MLSVAAVGISIAGSASAIDVEVLKVWSSADDCPNSADPCAYIQNGEVTSADIANRRIEAIDLIRNVIADSSKIAPGAIESTDAGNATATLYAEARDIAIPASSPGVPTARQVGFGGSDWVYTTHPTGWATNDFDFGQDGACRDSLGELVEGAGNPCLVVPKFGLWALDVQVVWHTDGSFEPGFPADPTGDWMWLDLVSGTLVDGICTVHPETGNYGRLHSQKVSPNSLLTPSAAPNDRVQTYSGTALLSAGDCLLPSIAERSEEVTADFSIVMTNELGVLSERGGTFPAK